MIQIRSWINIADNTGARRATMIGVIGRKTMVARIGDIVTANVKEAAPDGTVKKSEVVRAVIVRTRYPIRRTDGSYLRFDSNAAVIIDKDNQPRWSPARLEEVDPLVVAACFAPLGADELTFAGGPGA